MQIQEREQISIEPQRTIFILLPDGIQNGTTSGLVGHDLILAVQDLLCRSTTHSEFYRLQSSPGIVEDALIKRQPTVRSQINSSAFSQIILSLDLLRSQFLLCQEIEVEDLLTSLFCHLGAEVRTDTIVLRRETLPYIYPFLLETVDQNWKFQLEEAIIGKESKIFQLRGFWDQSFLHFIKDFLRSSIRYSISSKFVRNILHVPDSEQILETLRVFDAL